MDQGFVDILHRLGLSPINLSFYKTAFTHRSYLNESKEIRQSNERLEFLGDAVLSFIISSFLYTTHPSDTEGDMTNLRAYMVKTDSLAKVSQQLGLGDYLLLSKGEELSGGRENQQLLANTYEALLGAIYLDLGLEKASNFVEMTLLPVFEKEVASGAPRDPKSKLQEVAQSKFETSPKYKILETSGPDHARQFKVGVFVNGQQMGQGSGPNKQKAEEEAAKGALARLTKTNS